MHYQHIIWDYNGTLLNDVNLCVEVINDMLSERNLPLMTVPKYRELFDFPVKDYYAKAGFDFNKESFEIVGTEFIVEYDKRQKTSVLHSGVKELLIEIKNSGIKQSILSARKEEQLLEELKYFGIYDYFEEIVGLNDHYAGGKVERGIKLISKLNIPKDKILMIGDTKHDAEVAKETGINCILLSHGHHTKEKLKTCGVYVFDKISDIREFVKI
ncbi:MAG: HAD family hydrolase [Bacteroidales bacterium]|nr:HAD family hydrolase [Bacteroidales bacterium]